MCARLHIAIRAFFFFFVLLLALMQVILNFMLERQPARGCSRSAVLLAADNPCHSIFPPPGVEKPLNNRNRPPRALGVAASPKCRLRLRIGCRRALSNIRPAQEGEARSLWSSPRLSAMQLLRGGPLCLSTVCWSPAVPDKLDRNAFAVGFCRGVMRFWPASSGA